MSGGKLTGGGSKRPPAPAPDPGRAPSIAPRSSCSRRYGITALVCLLAAFGSLYLRRGGEPVPVAPVSPAQPSSARAQLAPEPAGPVALGAVRDRTYSFLQSIERGGTLITGRACDRNTGCVDDATSGLPLYAWRLLADARMLERTGDARYETQLMDHFGEWIRRANGPNELFSIHQLYDVYRITHRTEFLSWFWARVPTVHRLVKAWYLKQRTPKDAPMLLATLARELAYAALLLDSPQALAELRKIHAFDAAIDDPKSIAALRRDLLRDARILQAAVLAPGIASNTKSLIEGGPAIPFNGCWSTWARTAIAEAAHDTAELDRLVEFFHTADFAKRPRAKLGFVELQGVLACIHAAEDLGRLGKDLRSTQQALFKIVVDNEDRHSVCDGSGGILGMIYPEVARDWNGCRTAPKATSDNSWFVYLVDGGTEPWLFDS